MTPRLKTLILGTTLIGVLAGAAIAQGARFRDHDETTAGPMVLIPADTAPPGENETAIAPQNDINVMTGNSIPPHSVGAFPNPGNPNPISAQDLEVNIPAHPKAAAETTPLQIGWNFGVSVKGTFFDPIAAEFWAGDPRSGWNYNALGGAFGLGLDANYAHVQRTGKYHYHGIPFGLMELIDYSDTAHSPLVGYAADGFPIYALTGISDGELTQMTSSYRLKSGERPGGYEPTGAHDGTFHEDFEYVAGAGNLDECNGAMTVSKEYPNGTYAYFLTTDYPVIPMCWTGTPDNSFSSRPNP